MSANDFRYTKWLNRVGQFLQARTDTPVAIRLKNVAGGAVTSVTVTTATNLVIVTANGGTDTYAFATYDTVGKLVDAINADGIFEARVLDTLRSYATASQFVDGAITSGVTRAGVTVWDVRVDTSAAKYFARAAHPDRDMAVQPEVWRQRFVKVKKLDYAINVGGAADASVLLVARNGSAETTLISNASVDTTATTVFDGLSSEDSFLGGRGGEELVFLVLDTGGSIADATSNVLNVTAVVEL